MVVDGVRGGVVGQWDCRVTSQVKFQITKFADPIPFEQFGGSRTLVNSFSS